MQRKQNTEKLLYFGCYSPLAGARAIILQNSGFDVWCSVNPAEAPRLCVQQAIDLIVVCNTCDDELFSNLRQALQSNSLNVPILRLDSEHADAWRDPELLTLLVRGKLRQTTSPAIPPKREMGTERINQHQRRQA